MDYNPLSPESRANPYPGYALLRSEAPVHEIQPFGVFAVSRYRDVLNVLKSPDVYSSGGMRAMMAGQTGMMGNAANRGRTTTLLEANNLISSDPPIHDRLRAVVNRGFTPRRIAALEPRVREIARACLEHLPSSGEFDLVSTLSMPLPVRVIAELLGVPPERLHDFKRWSDVIVTSATGVTDEIDAETSLATREEFLDYFATAIAERRENPTDDLISTLIRAEDGEGTLSEGEVLSFTILLLVAGNETTTNLLGNALLALTEHPEQLAKVADNPDMIPGLVEEALRYDSPVQAVMRLTVRDTELAGVDIPKDKMVMLLLGSANRDEDWLPDAATFDATRDLKGHIGFGFGVHFCLGASLARLEARVALEELFSRCRMLERTTDQVEWIDSLILRGPKRVALRFEA